MQREAVPPRPGWQGKLEQLGFDYDGGAVEAAIVVLELLAIAADFPTVVQTAVALNAAAESRRRHTASARQFHVGATRKIELLVVEPPRNVQMRALDAVFVVRNAIHQLRDEPAHADTGRVREVLPDDAG